MLKAPRKSLKLFLSYRKGTYIWLGSLLKMFKGWKLQKQVKSVMVHVFCKLYHGDIHLHKGSRKSRNSFQVTEWTQTNYRNHYFQGSKGHNSKSRLTRVTILVFCTSSHDALHLCEVSSKYLNGFQLTEWTRGHSRNGYFQYLLCSKGCNWKSRLTRVTFYVFCTLSHGALHLWEVSSKYLEWFSTYRVDTSTW